MPKTPYGFQTRVAQEMRSNPHTVNTAKPGFGKTLMALLAASGAPQLFVMCPAAVVGSWRAEILDHGEWTPLRVADFTKGRKTVTLPPRGRAFIFTPDLLVRNKRAQDFLFERATKETVLVLDEAHMLMNPDAKRTQLVYGQACNGRSGLAARCGPVFPLTATPILGHAGQVWPHARFLAPERVDFQDYWTFTHANCEFKQTKIVTKRGNERWIETIAGTKPDRLPVLKAKFRGFTLKVTDDEAGLQLPPLRVIPRPIQVQKMPSRFELVEGLPEGVQAALAAFIETGDPDVLKGVGTQQHLARLLKMLGMVKVPATVEYAEELLVNEGVQKLVIWCVNRDVITGIRTGLAKVLGPQAVVEFTGDTSQQQRTNIVDSFQTQLFPRVIVGQIVAGGVGVTLTAATRELLVQQTFTPSLNYQAIKRCHRIGTTRPVLAEPLFVPETLDAAIATILARKTAEIAALDLSTPST